MAFQYVIVKNSGRGRGYLPTIMPEASSKAAISKWVKQFRDECQNDTKAQSDHDYMKENLRLRKELEEAKKEVLFLKKAAAFFAKEID